MSKVALKGNVTGNFFVAGLGFVACDIHEATSLTVEEASSIQQCARNLGTESSTVVAIPVIKSYAVCYIRQQDIDPSGCVLANARNPSPRRFATFDEAQHHGSRFMQTEGHNGFYVIETGDPVNAWVNQATGKTNPVL